MINLNYEYKNCPIPGGGYVTGFLFSENHKDNLYIRTDIGGVYKYHFDKNEFNCLSEYIDMFDLRGTFPSAIALSEDDKESLYIMSGVNNPPDKPFTKGLFSVSKDSGKTFCHYDVPFFVHGNLNGRGTGYRLIKKGEVIYYASQKNGLWKTDDEGINWTKIESLKEDYLTAIYVSDDNNIIIVGTAGLSNREDNMRGHGAYISFDSGISFEKLMMPENNPLADSKLNGFVPHRIASDDKYIYITMNYTGWDNYEVPFGYSCDSGSLLNGTVLRYEIDASLKKVSYKDITPKIEAFEDGIKNSAFIRRFGFGGISACKAMPGLIAIGTIGRGIGDEIYISKDYGETYEVALFDLCIGSLDFNTSYMKPQYNGGHSLIHWLSDVKINPFNPDEVWFNTGTGVFKGYDFTKSSRYFKDCSKGIEETVHLNVYSLPEGPIKVIDILGDLGGFAFKDLDKDCDNSFANSNGDRYITCINADFSDSAPNNVIVSARGNWKGKTKGGLILSTDYGQTFERIASPFGISEYTDNLLKRIETPNVNPGWVSLSSDAKNIVWNIAEGINLYMKGTIASFNKGIEFVKANIYDLCGNDISYSDDHFKVYSDSVNNNVFYGFADGLRLFISTDCGRNFYEINNSYPVPDAVLGLIDCANKTEIRRSAGFEGVFYASFGKDGLLKLEFDIDNKCCIVKKLSKPGDIIYRVGLGISRYSDKYYGEDKVIYVSAALNDVYGFYRSEDEGKSWAKLNDKEHSFGDINSIDGDCREFGLYYIATGSFGLKYGRETGR